MTSLNEISSMVEQLFEYETRLASTRNMVKALDEQAEEIRQRILGVLGEAGLKTFKAPMGTVTAAVRTSVKFPKDPEVKEALREYLLAKEAFDGMWSINSATLNSWFKAEKEVAEAEGRYLDIPGLEPTSDTILQFRKGGN